MKYILLVGLLSIASQAMAQTAVVEERINTDEGFPYKNLIIRADRVELSYIERGKEVECKVAVLSEKGRFEGQSRTARAKHLKHKPMASCLSRDEAKRILTLL